MSAPTSTLYPAGGLGAPKDRHTHAEEDNGLPAGTVVFSADNHISLSEDIFYEKFPAELKEKAPRIWYEDGAYMVGKAKGQTFLPPDFSRVLMQYDDLAGAATTNIEARIAELHSDGVDKELAFPNAVLALFHYPDMALRERVFRIYNEHIAALQERSNGHFYGVGLINWWDPDGARRTLDEVKALGLKTFLLPLNPGKGVDGEGVQIDEGDVNWPELAEQLDRLAPGVSFIPEIWMGHVNNGEGFWTGLDRLEKYL